ncbi:MAG: hypothetical protein ABIH34_05280 [Nanoarchaeota archaeon]
MGGHSGLPTLNYAVIRELEPSGEGIQETVDRLQKEGIHDFRGTPYSIMTCQYGFIQEYVFLMLHDIDDQGQWMKCRYDHSKHIRRPLEDEVCVEEIKVVRRMFQALSETDPAKNVFMLVGYDQSNCLDTNDIKQEWERSLEHNDRLRDRALQKMDDLAIRGADGLYTLKKVHAD